MSSIRTSTRSVRALAVVAVSALVLLLVAPSLRAAAPVNHRERLRKAVTVKGIKRHLEALQKIALANEGQRASGFNGYDQSVSYVANKLRNAGYQVHVQEFPFDAFIENAPAELEQVAPNQATYRNGEDFLYMEFSGSGDVTADVTNVDLQLPPGTEPSSSTSGCEPEDFANFPAGDIALIQRGFCDFGLKAQNAADAGAVGVIIFNEGQEGRTDLLNGTLGDYRPGIPVFGTTFELGQTLAGIDNLRLHMVADTTIKPGTTHNVLAQTPGGNRKNIVMAGGHLDSVQEGPGINDNGSGAMSLLEIALKMAKLDTPHKNRVRFAFWGAEEAGLVGSNYYVGNLLENRPVRFGNIALYLNFDMVASPNFARFIYDGDGSAFGLAGPPGSAQIEADFERFWDNAGRAHEPTEFSGRSDYSAFILTGIASGGLFSGAEGVKTEEQEELYGGIAGMSYDPCYHQACDTYFNINDRALSEFSNNMANIIAKYGMRLPEGVRDSSATTKSAAAARQLTHQGEHSIR